jgi:PKD repeat protein
MISANTTTSYAGNNVPITFSNLSTNASGYEWSVNNGSNPVSTFQTTHLFNDAGFYVMTLKANNGACLDTATATQNIIIYENQPSVVGIDTKSKEQNNYFFSKDENGLFVMFNYNEFTDVEFQVSNILGQVLIPNQILSVSTSKHYYKVPEGQQLILVTIKENGKPRTNKVLNK